MSRNAKIIAIVAILATAGIAAFYFYRKGKGSQLYADMQSLASQYIVGGFPQWIIDKAANRTSINMTDYYKVKGEATDASYLLAAYDQQYAGYGYEYKSGKAVKSADGKYTGEELALHGGLHSLLQQAQKN